MKLWSKDTTNTHNLVEEFTVGRDRELDMHMAEFDVLGSIAHAQMIASIGLLSSEECAAIVQALRVLLGRIRVGDFRINEGVEDIHSQVELELTQMLGDVGKKIHSGRSRNDQVLVDIKLFIRAQLQQIVHDVEQLFEQLLALSDAHQRVLMPGYTHLQIAMPSSFGLWFASYAESLVDDVILLQAAYRIVNKNPLGSAAGYGSSFPLRRAMTTELLGFEDLNYNVVYAQMGRGKAERITAQALASVAATLGKLAMDVTLFINQNFGFISFPDELTTGSSIMPHKKNPDVFELIRARCNHVQGLPNDIALLTANLPSGYHRDLQLTKEMLFPAFQELRSCVAMAAFALARVQVRSDILDSPMYEYLFTVEAVNRLVQEGVPFRDAYKRVGNDIAQGTFDAAKERERLQHTHEGSMGNLCNDDIRRMMQQEVARFQFERVERALERLRTGKFI
jgi:argininosuccinate lyase